jgi:hypothetical protein
MTTQASTDLIKLGHFFAEIESAHDLSRFKETVAPPTAYKTRTGPCR